MSRAHRLTAVVLLTVAVSTGAAFAADLTVAVVSLSSPAAPFTDATMQIQASTGAACVITVLYKSGPSRARGLYPQTADGRGRVTWVWRVGSNTTSGQWPIIVACEQGGNRAELRTRFEVR